MGRTGTACPTPQVLPYYGGSKDCHVRAALKTTLLAQALRDPDTVVVDELTLRHAPGRIDLAVINGHFLGFEIKSDRDSLGRLPKQISYYNAVFDEITLVVSVRHQCKAIDLIPDYWGVVVAETTNSGIEISLTRAAAPNPSVDVSAVVRFLWRTEALRWLQELGLARGLHGQSLGVLYARLISVVDKDTLQARVRHDLRVRTRSQLDARSAADGGSSLLQATLLDSQVS